MIPEKESEPWRVFASHPPPWPGAYKKLKDDAGVWVVVLEADGARLLQVDGVHQCGRALICVGGDVVTQGNPLGPVGWSRGPVHHQGHGPSGFVDLLGFWGNPGFVIHKQKLRPEMLSKE